VMTELTIAKRVNLWIGLAMSAHLCQLIYVSLEMIIRLC
jgi:hypothetical protein